jgi:hypothetical protein
MTSQSRLWRASAVCTRITETYWFFAHISLIFFHENEYNNRL